MAISSSGPLSAAKSSSMMQSEQRERRVCKQCDLVPSRVFCIVSFRPRAKMLVGNFPNPFQTASSGCRLRVPSERFYSPYKQKSTPKADAKSTFGVFHLPALLPVRLRCLICKESLDIFLCPQKPLHLLPGLAVFRVDCLLLLEQFSVLSVQLLHLGQLFDTLLIKKFFGCLGRSASAAQIFRPSASLRL